MYDFLVATHNVVRWIVVILGSVAVIRAFWGWFGKKEWTLSERKIGILFTSAIDVQLLLGIILYFVVSEWGLKTILNQGMSFVMSDSTYRFFAIEHAFLMILGVIFAHLGSMLPKKVDDSQSKFKSAAIWFMLALVVIFAGIPWATRPLFPGL
jgi:putative Ca2+/H+ antiporter (TMEM165/GDT1 family)